MAASCRNSVVYPSKQGACNVTNTHKHTSLLRLHIESDTERGKERFAVVEQRSKHRVRIVGNYVQNMYTANRQRRMAFDGYKPEQQIRMVKGRLPCASLSLMERSHQDWLRGYVNLYNAFLYKHHVT